MASLYPHKQTAIIAIICVIAIGGAYTYTRGYPFAQNSEEDAATITPGEVDTSTYDWRSGFSGSNAPIARQEDARSVDDAPLTLTDQLGRDFFARYIQIQQSGLIDNQEFVQGALDQAIQSAAQASEQAPTYAETDISISPDVSTDALKAYGNTVANAFSIYGIDGDVAEIANAALERGDSSGLDRIDAIADSYGRILSAVDRTSVPQPLVPYHLDLLNGLSRIEAATRHIHDVESDPVQAIVSVSQYASIQSSVLSALQSMRSYFSIVSVTFGPSEPGSLFAYLP